MVEQARRADDTMMRCQLPSRRAILRGVIAGLAGLAGPRFLSAQEDSGQGPVSDDAEIALVENKAKEAGLGGVESTKTEHFLGVGNASRSFQREGLRRCEALGGAFLAHFRGRGFQLAYPAGRLTVIVLKDAQSYATLLGEAPGEEVGGHYDVGTNRLVIFDFRPGQNELGARAERVNLFTLVHETAHQLTFNTGMLDRRGNLPLSILEGLATYVEMWRPGVKNGIGGVNLPRLEALRRSEDWIPIADLLAGDKAFEPQTQQLAYAESWLLVHYLLRSSVRQPRFRSYLSQAQALKKPDDRMRIAEKTLGPLDRLEHAVKADGREYLRR